MPPLSSKRENIARVLCSHEEETDSLNSFLQKALLLKAGLMQDLLTGKKRVTELLNMKELISV